VLSTNTFHDLPPARDFEWKEDPRSLPWPSTAPTCRMLDQKHARDALVPAENMGAGRS